MALRKLPLHLRLNAPAEFEQLQFPRQVAVYFAQPHARVRLFEQMLALSVA